MRQEWRERFPATPGKRSRHASRQVRDARAMMHARNANCGFLLLVKKPSPLSAA